MLASCLQNGLLPPSTHQRNQPGIQLDFKRRIADLKWNHKYMSLNFCSGIDDAILFPHILCWKPNLIQRGFPVYCVKQRSMCSEMVSNVNISNTEWFISDSYLRSSATSSWILHRTSWGSYRAINFWSYSRYGRSFRQHVCRFGYHKNENKIRHKSIFI